MFRNIPCRLVCFLALGFVLFSCAERLDIPEPPGVSSQSSSGSSAPSQNKISFPVTVTRDGEAIPEEAITKGGPDAGDRIATMDSSIPFGIIGLDMEYRTLLVDNVPVSATSSGYAGMFDSRMWDILTPITFSAYYPYVDNVTYDDEYSSYNIPFSTSETEAGPLVSKTTQKAIQELNMIPLEFQHITNDIGYKICDVTTDPQLQGLIHLRKVTATNVASAGVFVNDIAMSRGFWHRQGYYRDVVVFEGDDLVGVGMENEKFIGYSTLVDHMVDSNRYYSIPDEILMGKQCVEVIYDVDSFTVGGFTYPAMPDQAAHYMLYGLLPDNVFEYGKQYTFHLGLDTGKLYSQVAFSASVSDWETKIYENNDDF